MGTKLTTSDIKINFVLIFMIYAFSQEALLYAGSNSNYDIFLL